MRVLYCKSKCLSICFSESSPEVLQTPPPLKLEDGCGFPREQSANEEEIEKPEKAAEAGGERVETCLKSSLKKSLESGSGLVVKGRVKWMDLVGKDLVEIREFEPIDSEDSDEDNGNQTCVCAIQ